MVRHTRALCKPDLRPGYQPVGARILCLGDAAGAARSGYYAYRRFRSSGEAAPAIFGDYRPSDRLFYAHYPAGAPTRNIDARDRHGESGLNLDLAARDLQPLPERHVFCARFLVYPSLLQNTGIVFAEIVQ